MKKIKEVIVVEGRDDINAVKRAINAELIAVNGYSVNKRSTLEKIKKAHERVGVIVLTDPDYAGEHIRRIIMNYVPTVKHAYIDRLDGTREKDGNIGIENAKPEVIIKALEKVQYKLIEEQVEFTQKDMLQNNLAGGEGSTGRRHKLSNILGIGYSNGKQFLAKLNYYGIKRKEFENAIIEINKISN